jgi:hypothetical protein
MTFKPGQGGRPKGARNKLTGEMREMIRQALDQAGGLRYLVRQANENPRAFLALVGKLISPEVQADVTSGGETLAEALSRARARVTAMGQEPGKAGR